MEKPSSPYAFDNRAMTPKELTRMHQEIDWYDRDATIQDIDDIVHEIKENSSPAEMWEALKQIGECCSEFIN